MYIENLKITRQFWMSELSYVSFYFFFVRKCDHWGWYRLEGAKTQNPLNLHLKGVLGRDNCNVQSCSRIAQPLAKYGMIQPDSAAFMS